MKFIKKFFTHDNIVIGLSSIRKKENYIKILFPENYKHAKIFNVDTNYLLF